MGHKIREQMDKSDFQGLLSEHVEADEAYGKRDADPLLPFLT